MRVAKHKTLFVLKIVEIKKKTTKKQQKLVNGKYVISEWIDIEISTQAFTREPRAHWIFIWVIPYTYFTRFILKYISKR